MKVFEANITNLVSDFLNENLKNIVSLKPANQRMYEASGIINFFENIEELEGLKKAISTNCNIAEEPDRGEYGDFQTNINLANKVCSNLKAKKIFPEIVVEPTCGKGNFILATLLNFPGIKNIFGIEIYKPYVWETKFAIINFFLEYPEINKPTISIVHSNVFDFDFNKIANRFPEKEILIIGNPPWVTNSKLGSLNSTNLPKKTNFKNHSGLDAMTGKGNFDIAEFITLSLLETFQKMKGNLLLLVKNSVIKNIVFEQYKKKYLISEIEKHCIDTKKEFNVSVEAALFFCQLNSAPAFISKEFNFYENNNHYLNFGWVNKKFVSNIDLYVRTKEIDGKCPFVWRQGLKHDCSSIMELDKVNSSNEKYNGLYLNGLNEKIELEDNLVFGILKSSDLKNTVINQPRKFTIVTQRKVGQETKYIKSEFPKTYQYLVAHQSNFKSRKSIIYHNKPLYSIFGIGDYSFKPFKVAISGLYKTFHFTLILPHNNKPVMLDDTCYFIGFDTLENAVYTLILLNSEITKHFLQSVTFADAKRTFTKDVLMRINLLELAGKLNVKELQTELIKLNEMYGFTVNLNLWENFINEMMPLKNKQIELFA